MRSKMSAVGFEPTSPKTLRPERNPLDHSGKLTRRYLHLSTTSNTPGHTTQHTHSSDANTTQPITPVQLQHQTPPIKLATTSSISSQRTQALHSTRMPLTGHSAMYWLAHTKRLWKMSLVIDLVHPLIAVSVFVHCTFSCHTQLEGRRRRSSIMPRCPCPGRAFTRQPPHSHLTWRI